MKTLARKTLAKWRPAVRWCGCLLPLCLSLASCTAEPPSVNHLAKSTEIGPDRQVTVLIDACIQEVLLTEQPYFLATESRAGANALLRAALGLIPGDVVVRARLVPFVCGARMQAGDEPRRLSDHIGAPVTSSRQPFDVSVDIAADPAYARALSVASTYLFAHSPSVSAPGDVMPANELVSKPAFRDALAVIASRTQSSTLLYVGAFGTSLSREGAFALGVAQFALGMTAGVIIRVPLNIVPGQKVDSRVMAASLVDLKTREIVRSNAVRADGDPVKPEVLARPDTLDLLLNSAIFDRRAAN